MNSDTPFNPIPIPAGFNFGPETDSALPPQDAPPSEEPGTRQARTRTRTKRSRHQHSTTAAFKAKCHQKWQKIKGKFSEKLQGLDREKLKALLLACGIAAGVAVSIVLAVKLVPVAVMVLAVLGIGAVIRIWDRLRRFTPPF